MKISDTSNTLSELHTALDVQSVLTQITDGCANWRANPDLQTRRNIHLLDVLMKHANNGSERLHYQQLNFDNPHHREILALRPKVRAAQKEVFGLHDEWVMRPENRYGWANR